ncbi:intraflagellar transport protein 20 homolog [Drosophila eugracilis]|uniref:intraflagellar transport protein 20 homolog n=1 Tax=Drosophila eugracilis TaxID=29029 RepID=UPI001BD9C5BA|nr:intraflagellar transport protein 20 homolog [Drosophila eugracilis]
MEELQRIGLFIDDIYGLRVENPSFTDNRIKYKNKCEQYSKYVNSFKKFASDFYNISDLLGKDVDIEKLRAIGTYNRFKNIHNQHQSKEVYQSEIFERVARLELLKSELQYLQQIVTEQHEIINNFIVSPY